jgi:thioester reductase-like protein
VVVVPGDLELPRMGLSVQDYDRLAESVDTVVHNAALVNLVLGYGSHRAANVGGTTAMLRLAAHRRVKHVHFVSTLAALAGPVDGGAPVAEEAVSERAVPTSGYGRSKWVAERLLDAAADRGIPVTVYRLGEVMPHSMRGVPSRGGLVDQLVKSCLRIGACFRSPIVTDYTPVDLVSAIVCAGVAAGTRGWFHVLHPNPVRFDTLLGGFRDEFGLTELSYREFWNLLRDVVAADPSELELARVLAALPPAGPDVDDHTLRELLTSLFRDGTRWVARRRVGDLLAGAALDWPRLDGGAFARYAAYYRAQGAAVERIGPAQVGTR